MDLALLMEQNRGLVLMVLKHIVVLSIIWFITSTFANMAGKYFSQPRRGTRLFKLDETRRKFLRHLSRGGIYFLGIAASIHSIPALRAISTSLFAGAGVAALIIGFASQQAFSNIVSGIFITLFRPFRVGDRVIIGATEGVVEDITMRHTAIRNWQNNYVIIPNSVISNEVIVNQDIRDSKTCRYVEIGIAYDADIDKATKIIQKEIMKHPNWIDMRTEEEIKDKKDAVTVRLISFGDSSVNLRGYAWAESPGKAWVLGTDVNKTIKSAFDKADIEIPFPYRTIVYKKDEKKPKKKRARK